LRSGGRGSKAIQIRNYNGRLIEENLKELAEHIMMIGWIDNQVIQRVLPSSPRFWASKIYLEKLRQGLVSKGIPAPDDAQYFSYVRIISLRDQEGDEIYVLPLVVTSRATISNVGRGGVLFELLPEYFISPEQYKLFLEEMKRVASKSLKLTQKSSENLIKKLKQNEYLDNAARLMKERILISLKNNYQDLTGWTYTKPRYMMFDMIPIPILKIAEKMWRLAEIIEVRYNNRGNLSHFMVFDSERMKIIDVSVENIIGWDMVLIENNVGYGLWYPFKEDQKIREYERSEIEKVGISPFNWGQDLRKIMYAFSTGASSFYKKIHGKVPSIKPLEEIKPIYSISSLLYSLDDKISLEALKQKGIAGLSESLTKILTKYLGADKINNWRGEWNDDTSTEIVNELSKLVNINQTSIWLKLKKETGLSTQILSKILDINYIKRIFLDVCDIIFNERLVA
jgi:hypothetical protein